MTNYTPPTIRHRVWHPSTTFACSVASAAGLASRNQKCAPWAKRPEFSLVFHAIFLLVACADRRRHFLCNEQQIVLPAEPGQLFTHLICARECRHRDTTEMKSELQDLGGPAKTTPHWAPIDFTTTIDAEKKVQPNPRSSFPFLPRAVKCCM